MRYQQAYDYINSFTNYERTPGLRQDLGADGLERFRLLTRLIGRPYTGFRSIVIAGTKGKGSVAAMLDSVLRAAGYRTGLYTSPHLHTFRERIRVNGALISPADMARIVEGVQPIIERIRGLGDNTLLPTTYELATAIAFQYFKEQGVQVAVLEVGLGGRLDAVNIVEPLVSVITSLSLDHTEILGDTLAKIAGEKAGIIKPHGHVVSAPQPEEVIQVLNEVAAQQRASLEVVGREIYVSTGHLPEIVVDNEGVPIFQTFTIGFEAERNAASSKNAAGGGKIRLRLPLLGSHQQVNAAVALAALRVAQAGGLPVDKNAILNGLANVQWPGRMEVIHRHPLVVADGAHNVDSIAKLGQSMIDIFTQRAAVVVLGISRDKDIEGILQEIRAWLDGLAGPKIERLIVTRSIHPRAADPRTVAQQAVALGFTVEMRENVREALSRAEAIAISCFSSSEPGPVVLVTGSLFIVAEAREYYGLVTNLGEEQI